MLWKKVPNTYYSISEYGDLRNNKTNRILKKRIDSHGYVLYNIYDGIGKSKRFLAHRIVASVFIGDAPESKNQVNHIDGDTQNNHYLNLEWCTAKENSQHAVKIGLFPRGQTHHLSRLSDNDVDEIRLLVSTGLSQRRVAEKFGIDPSVVSRYVNRKRGGAYR